MAFNSTEVTCTVIKEVTKHFVDHCYVCVSKTAAFPFAPCPNGQCTCDVYSRYGDCEHAEFVRMLAIRVRQPTVSGDSIPIQRKRGRKPGSSTSRGKARAQKRLIPEAGQISMPKVRSRIAKRHVVKAPKATKAVRTERGHKS